MRRFILDVRFENKDRFEAVIQFELCAPREDQEIFINLNWDGSAIGYPGYYQTPDKGLLGIAVVLMPSEFQVDGFSKDLRNLVLTARAVESQQDVERLIQRKFVDFTILSAAMIAPPLRFTGEGICKDEELDLTDAASCSR